MAWGEVFDFRSTERCRHIYPLDKLAKLRGLYGGLTKACDFNIPETWRIDSCYETVQVLASSSIFKARESRKSNARPWR